MYNKCYERCSKASANKRAACRKRCEDAKSDLCYDKCSPDVTVRRECSGVPRSCLAARFSVFPDILPQSWMRQHAFWLAFQTGNMF